MKRSTNNPWLNRYAWFTAFCTLVLICFGGLVTSHGAGLAVPDWPNSYGYNMFLFPASQWLFTRNGIFYEHSHRLVASGVGFLTIILAVWLWRRESRSWVRWLGWLALLLVIVQGILGGLRVTLLNDALGMVHGALAQTFFSLIAAIALVTSRFWHRLPRGLAAARAVRGVLLLATGLIFLQLLLGAGMRHRHAGLAVPDFPLAYGRLWPATDADALAGYNQRRLETTAAHEIEAIDVHLHLTHRYLALGVVAAVITAAVRLRRRLGGGPLVAAGWVWVGMIAVQATLGAWTVLSGKAADVATAHVAVGSTSLVLGVLLCMAALRMASEARARAAEPGDLQRLRGSREPILAV